MVSRGCTVEWDPSSLSLSRPFVPFSFLRRGRLLMEFGAQAAILFLAKEKIYQATVKVRRRLVRFGEGGN